MLPSNSGLGSVLLDCWGRVPPPHCHPYPVRCQLLSPLFPLLFGFGKEDTLLHTHIINHLLTNSGSWWGSDGKRAVLMDGLDTGSLDSLHGQTGFATTFFLLIPSLSMSQGIKEPMIRRKHFPPTCILKWCSLQEGYTTCLFLTTHTSTWNFWNYFVRCPVFKMVAPFPAPHGHSCWVLERWRHLK